MARYNSLPTNFTTSGASTVPAPTAGIVTTITGTAPFTVTLPSPTLSAGYAQSLYNNATGAVTLATPSGVINGPGASGTSSVQFPQYAFYTLVSDGTNYILATNAGGNAVNFTESITGTLNANGTAVNIKPSSLSILPSSVGTVDNVNIGAATPGNIYVNTLTLNTTMNGNGTIVGGTF